MDGYAHVSAGSLWQQKYGRKALLFACSNIYTSELNYTFLNPNQVKFKKKKLEKIIGFENIF